MITLKDAKLNLIELQEARKAEKHSLENSVKQAERKDKQGSLFDEDAEMKAKYSFASILDQKEYSRAKASIKRLDKRIEVNKRVVEYLSGGPSPVFIKQEYDKIKSLIDRLEERFKLYAGGKRLNDADKKIFKNEIQEWGKDCNIKDLRMKAEVLRVILKQPKEITNE